MLSQRSGSSKSPPPTAPSTGVTPLTDLFTVCIPQTEDVVTPFGRHTRYTIEINFVNKIITTHKRYSQFRQLSQSYETSFPDLIDFFPVLPPKKYFGSGDPCFVEERRQGLEHYLRALLNEDVVVHSDFFWQFVEVDECLVVFSRFLTLCIPNISPPPAPPEYCPILTGDFGGGFARASSQSCAQQAFYVGHILGLVHRLLVISNGTAITNLLGSPSIIRRVIQCSACGTAEVLTRICLILRIASFSEHPALLEVLSKEGTLGAVLSLLEDSLSKWGPSAPLQFLNASRVFCVNLVRTKPSSLLFFFAHQGGLNVCLRFLHASSPLAIAVIHPLVCILIWLALPLPEVQFTLAEQGESLGLEVLGAMYKSPNVTARLLSGLVLSALLKSRRFESRDGQRNEQCLSSETSLKAAASVEVLARSIHEDSCRKLKTHPMDLPSNSHFSTFVPNLPSQPPTIIITSDPLKETKNAAPAWVPPETPRDSASTSSCGFLGPLWYVNRSPPATYRPASLSFDEQLRRDSDIGLEIIGNPWLRVEYGEIDYFYLLVILQREGANRLVALLSSLPESKEVTFFSLWVIALVVCRPHHMHTTGSQRRREVDDQIKPHRLAASKTIDECQSLSPTRSSVGLRLAVAACPKAPGPFVSKDSNVDRRNSKTTQPLLSPSQTIREYAGLETGGNPQDIHIYPHSSLSISLQNSFLFDELLLSSCSFFGDDPTERFLAAVGDPIAALVNSGVLASLEDLVQWGRTPGIRALAAVSLLHVPWVILDKSGGLPTAHSNVKGRWSRRPSLPAMPVEFPDGLLELRIKIRAALMEYMEKQLDTSRSFLRTEADRLSHKEECIQERQRVEICGMSQLKDFTESTWEFSARRVSLSDAVGDARDFINDMRSRLESVAMTRGGLKEQSKSHQMKMRELSQELAEADKSLNWMKDTENTLVNLKLQADDLLKNLMEKSQNVRQLTENLRAVRRQAAHHRERWLEIERIIAAAPTKRQVILDQIRSKNSQKSTIEDCLNETKKTLISEQSRLGSAANEVKSLDLALLALDGVLIRLKGISANDVESPGSTSALGELARELPEMAVDDKIRDFVSCPGPLGSAAARLRETLENRIDVLQKRRNEIFGSSVCQKVVRELASSHRSLENESQKISGEIEALEAQLSSHSNQQNLTKRSEELQAEVRATESEVEVRSHELSDVEAECRMMEKELENLRSRVRSCEIESQQARETVARLVRESNAARASLGRELVDEEVSLRAALGNTVALREDCLYVSSKRFELDVLLLKERTRRLEYRKQIQELIGALESVDTRLAAIDDEPVSQLSMSLPMNFANQSTADDEETIAVFE